MKRVVFKRVAVSMIVAVLVLTGVSGLSRAFPPAPTALASATPLNAVPGEPILFSGTGSVPGSPANTLTYTWYFGDMESDTGATVSHAFEFDGVYDVTLIIQESNGLMALDTVRVTITSPVYGSGGVNGAVIHMQPPAPATVAEDASIEFDCLESWPPGTDPATLTCAWDFGDGETTGPTSAYDMQTHTYGYAGTYTVRLVVRDSKGHGDATSVDVTVNNLAPVAPATPFMWTPANPVEDTSVLFDATDGWDTPTDNIFLALGFAWDFGDGGRGSDDQAIHTFNQPGTYSVTVTATDDNGLTATATRSVTVGNLVPTASAPAVTVKEAETARFDATTSTDTASDAGALTYSWTGGLPAGMRPTTVWYDEGSPEVILTVSDGHPGGTATATPTVTVQNRAPYASITNAVKSGSNVIVTGIVHEVGADSLTLTFNWGHDGQTSTQTFTNTLGESPFRKIWSPSHHFPSSQTWYMVTLTATDGDGGSNTASASIKGGGSIDNKAPEVTAVSVDQTSKAEDSSFSFTASISNPDGPSNPPTTYLWEFGDGATATTASPSHAYARAGTYTVILKATDGAGDWGANSRQVTVTNSAPTASFTVSQSSPYEDDAVMFTATATDTVSDVAALRYAWDFGDGGRASGATATHTYRTPGARTVTLTVTDDNAAAVTPAPTQPITVVNRPPTAGFYVYALTSGRSSAVAAGTPPNPPANPKERRAALFSALTSFDGPSDEALLTYFWDFGDGATTTGMHAMHAFASQGTYYVRLRVTDNHGAEDWEPDAFIGRPVTVDDTAAVPFAGPEMATYGAEALLLFHGSGDDDDAETLDYIWDFGLSCVPPMICPTALGPDVEFVYTETGVYTVTLTVTDVSGSSAIDTLTVAVNMDSDGDQLSDEFEPPNDLNPFDPDTDDDFLLDYVEALFGTDPTRDDSDDDGLIDWEELFVGDDLYTTDPVCADSDGDLLGDGMEDGLYNPFLQGWAFDTDMGKWDGGWQRALCGGVTVDVVYGPDTDPSSTTNPMLADMDGDGLPDGWIDNGNLFPDIGEYEDRNHDGAVGLGEWLGGLGSGETDPRMEDTDTDGLLDSVEIGAIGYDSDPSTTTDPFDWDTDGDNLPDGWINYNGNDDRDYGEFEDTDLDGTQDSGLWFAWGGSGETNPLDANTDGDDLDDYFEEVTGVKLAHTWGTGLIPDGYGELSLTTDHIRAGSPQPYLKAVNVEIMLVHPEPSDLELELTRAGGLPKPMELPSQHLFDDVWLDDYDLSGLGFTYSELASPESYTLTVRDTVSGDSGTLLAFWVAFIARTDPLTYDCDGDGLDDGVEDHGWAPQRVSSDPWQDDTDGDLLPDSEELARGLSPVLSDSDVDGLSDYAEINTYATEPAVDDTDQDSMSDGAEVSALGSGDLDLDGISNLLDWDSDGDMISDGLDPDPAVFNRPDGSAFSFDELTVNNGLGVSVAVDYDYNGGSAPDITPWSPPPSDPLPGGIGPTFQITAVGNVEEAMVKVNLDGVLADNDPGWSRLAVYKWNPSSPYDSKWEIQRESGVSMWHSAWLVTNGFSEFGVADSGADLRGPDDEPGQGTPDSDHDGINDWHEFYCAYTGTGRCGYSWRFAKTHSDVDTQPGDDFYIHNIYRSIKVPDFKVHWDGSTVDFIIDLLDLGFPEDEIEAESAWWVTRYSFRDYSVTFIVGLYTLSDTWDRLFNAPIQFTYITGNPDENAFIRSGIQGSTDPLDYDSDDDGVSDGEEAYQLQSNPINEDTDSDGYSDSIDYNPLEDLKLDVLISRWGEMDYVDQVGCGDYYGRVSMNWIWQQSDPPGEGENCNTYPNRHFYFDIPDDQSYVVVSFQLVDDDGIWSGDDYMDISAQPSSGQGQDKISDVTRIVTLVFSTKFGTWYDAYDADTGDYSTGEDPPDSSVGREGDNDQDDGYIEFDLQMNDVDFDAFPWWQEVYDRDSDPWRDDDGGSGDDQDNDGLLDSWEQTYYHPPDYPCPNPGVSDAFVDCEPDGMPNWEEFYWGSNPIIDDTDNDGLKDGYEAGIGRPSYVELNPKNPADAVPHTDRLRDWLSTFVGRLRVDSHVTDFPYFRDNVHANVFSNLVLEFKHMLGVPEGYEDALEPGEIAAFLRAYSLPEAANALWSGTMAFINFAIAIDTFNDVLEITGITSECITTPPTANSPLAEPGLISLVGYANGCTSGLGLNVAAIADQIEMLVSWARPEVFDPFVQSASGLVLPLWGPQGTASGFVTLPLMKPDGTEDMIDLPFTGYEWEDKALQYAEKVWNDWKDDWNYVGCPRNRPCSHIGDYDRNTPVSWVARYVVEYYVRAYQDLVTVRSVLQQISDFWD